MSTRSKPLAEALPSQQSKGLYAMALPDSLPPGKYVVRASGVEAAQVHVTVKAAAATIMMESDKAVYKPGQEAHFRVLALSAGQLLPLANVEIEFSIRSPEGFKLMSVNKGTDDAGVARFSFPIASEPLLGDHVAEAVVQAAGARAASQGTVAFVVDEYVLPRFEVNLTMDHTTVYVDPKNLRGATARLTGKVSGLFTFGEAVVGQATVTAWSPAPRPRPELGRMAAPGKIPERGAEHKALAKVSGIKVTAAKPAAFELPIQKDSLRYGTSLTIEATVVSDATLESQSTTRSVFVAYVGRDLRVHLEMADGQRVFKPRLPFKVKVKLAKLDGTPPSKEDLADLKSLQLVAEANTVDYKHQKKLQAQLISLSPNAEGIAEVEVTPSLHETSSCCNLAATRTTYDEYKEACGCCVSTYNVHVEVKYPTQSYNTRLRRNDDNDDDVDSLCLSRAYSPTDEYITVSSADARTGALTLFSSVDPQELKNMAEYMLIRGGALIGGGVTELKKDSITADHSYWKVEATVPMPTAASGEIQLIVAVMPLKGSLQLTATATLSRSLQLPFELTASFLEEEVTPGSPVTIRLGAGATVSGQVPRNLHAFVTSVDRSVELLGSRAAINEAALMQKLESAGAAIDEPVVASKPWKECQRRGSVLVSELPDTLMAITKSSEEDAALDDMESPYGKTVYSCPRPLQSGCFGFGGGDPEMFMEMADAAPMMARTAKAAPKDDAVAAGNAAEDSDQSEPSEGSLTTRKFFPETWIWEDFAFDASKTTKSFVAPDTITSWSLEAFATCKDEGLSAVRAKVPLKVFKPFFVEMRLPYSAVRGEDLDVTFAVFNYLEGSGEITAELQVRLPDELFSEGFSVSSSSLTSSSLTTKLAVREGEAKSITLAVSPQTMGTFKIGAMVTTGSAARTTKTDAIERPLLVKPQGIPKEETKNVVVDLSSGGGSRDSIDLPLPEDAVKGSERLSVSVVGDILGPTLSGLDQLLRIPSGCGEQNMIGLAPNVYVGKYLQSVNKLTPKLKEKIVRNIIVGYGRELTYRHPDGSFSAFGKSDKEGSTWLTAFVLRVFAEVQDSGLVAVDSKILVAAASFLVNSQNKDGSFQAKGKVIHTEMTGGASKGLSLSAYVTSALAKAKAYVPGLADDVSGLWTALEKAQNYLASKQSEDTYSVLLRAHALALADLWKPSQVAKECLRVSHVKDGRRWWAQSEPPTELASRGRQPARAQDIELTGYGVLALTLAGKLTEAFEGARWLLERRSASGGFMSTQDTVVGLNALATYAAAAAGSVDMQITVKDQDKFSEVLSVSPKNVDVLQTVSLPTPGSSVSVEASGQGFALVVAELRYNLPRDTFRPCYDIQTDLFTSAGSSLTIIKGCVQPRVDCVYPLSRGMAIISIGLYTGYEAAIPSLKALKIRRPQVKRWETSDARVDLYLEDLDRATCVEFQASKKFNVRNVQPVASEVYEYYAPDIKGSTVSVFAPRELDVPVQEDGGFAPELLPQVGDFKEEPSDLPVVNASLAWSGCVSVVWACLFLDFLRANF